MKWSACCCLLATFAILCLMDAGRTFAAPSARTDDLLKTLQDLEQIYSSMARPRFGKRDPIINHNALYRNFDTDYSDLQSIDDGHVPVARWRTDGIAPDTEMRSVSGRISSRDTSPSSLRQRQLQQLQHLYQYQLN